jgi:hypothetical protein
LIFYPVPVSGIGPGKEGIQTAFCLDVRELKLKATLPARAEFGGASWPEADLPFNVSFM